MSAVLEMRNASGHRISILNDENIPPQTLTRPPLAALTPFDRQTPQTFSTPSTPELLRSNSYDSHRGTPPISPITPLYEPGYLYSPAAGYLGTPVSGPEMRPPSDESAIGHAAERRFSYEALERRPSYDGGFCTDVTPGGHQDNETKPRKLYHCRFRDEYQCDKRFTTSGHASRHAKIHTSEKAVRCDYEGCDRKFTRADNMKQHLETHYKKKSRSAVPRSLPSRGRRGSAARRRSISPRTLSPTEDAADQRARMAIEAQAYAGASAFPPFPAPQVAEQPYYRGMLPAAPKTATTVPVVPSPAMAPTVTIGLDALASVALQQ